MVPLTRERRQPRAAKWPEKCVEEKGGGGGRSRKERGGDRESGQASGIQPWAHENVPSLLLKLAGVGLDPSSKSF